MDHPSSRGSHDGIGESLPPGLTNAGSVVRVGETVRRPRQTNSEGVQSLLRHLSKNGFEGAPQPLGFDAEGREVLTFVEGDVPRRPLPAWASTTEALVSIAQLLAAFRTAARGFPVDTHRWYSPPVPGEYATQAQIGHNDFDYGNIVFRDEVAVAVIDFDYAAPSDLIWEVATAAYYLVPLRASSLSEVDVARGLEAFVEATLLPRVHRHQLLAAVQAFHAWRWRRAARERPPRSAAWIERYRNDTRWLQAAGVHIFRGLGWA